MSLEKTSLTPLKSSRSFGNNSTKLTVRERIARQDKLEDQQNVVRHGLHWSLKLSGLAIFSSALVAGYNIMDPSDPTDRIQMQMALQPDATIFEATIDAFDFSDVAIAVTIILMAWYAVKPLHKWAAHWGNEAKMHDEFRADRGKRSKQWDL